LLHYFFRGQIDMTPSEDDPQAYVIHNDSDEEMDGDFRLYYDYKSAHSESRMSIANWPLVIPPGGTSEPVTFLWPDSTFAAEPGKFILVFKGNWGEEKENTAVVGKVVTLPVSGWREEWDNGLTGNHPWLTTDIELTGINPPNGETINFVSGGVLTKENIRYVGSSEGRLNQSLIMESFQSPWGTYCIDEYFSHCVPFDFGIDFPLAISPATILKVKIDEIFINSDIPYQSCSGHYGPGYYHGIMMKIRDQNGNYNLFFTISGSQLPPSSSSPLRVSYVIPGQTRSFNIFSAFGQSGITFVEPVELLSINIIQHLGKLCSPSPIEYLQRIAVDYIRLED
jgi:hypothetical protein